MIGFGFVFVDKSRFAAASPVVLPRPLPPPVVPATLSKKRKALSLVPEGTTEKPTEGPTEKPTEGRTEGPTEPSKKEPKKPRLRMVKPKAPCLITTKPTFEGVVKQELALGTPLFVYMLAEDFVKHVLLESSDDFYFYVDLWKPLFTVLPTTQFFKMQALEPDINVMAAFQTEYPSFLKELSPLLPLKSSQCLFLSFLFRWCATLYYAKEVQLKKTKHGLELWTRRPFSDTPPMVVSSAWSVRVTLLPVHQAFIKEHMGSLKNMFTVLEQTYLVLGPLSYVVQGCKVCHNVAPNSKGNWWKSYPYRGPDSEEQFTSLSLFKTSECLEKQLVLACRPLLGEDLFRCSSKLCSDHRESRYTFKM